MRLQVYFSFFLQVDGYPVYSMATPTIAGAKEMLTYLGARPELPSEGNGPKKVIITDLREEAVVYINGTPFVLRELNKPVDTLKHVGITGTVVRFCYNVELTRWAGWADLVICQNRFFHFCMLWNEPDRVGFTVYQQSHFFFFV